MDTSFRKKAFFQKPIVKKPLLALYNFYWESIARIMSDEAYLKYVYKRNFHRELNLENPQSFNEKLNWLKLYNRNPLYTQLADKYQVKKIVAERIGSKYVVPNYGVWERFDDIDFDTLPNQFVLKTTGDSFGVTLCKDKTCFDKKAAKDKFTYCLKKNYYYRTREWPYKDIKQRIIADMLLDEHTGHELRDYKFWCFNGVPKIMYLTNKGSHITENFYDMDFNPVMDIDHGFPRVQPEFKKPECFDEMKQLAAKLSQGIPFVRIDFFYVGGKVYFGEFTFFDWAGLYPFKTYEMDLRIGSWLELPTTRIQ